MANTNTSEKKQDKKEKKLMTGTNTVSGSGSPTAGGGVKSREDYYNDVYGKAKTAVDEQHASRLATDTDTKTRINEAIDKAAAASTGRYQTQIDNAPRESRVQFDQNAVRDAVAKKQVQERLANMGVTDSGLNSSMQTAMAIQKQRADNTVRSEERAKIQAAQDAINQIMAESDSKKAEQGIAIDRATADWYNQVMAQLPTQAYGLANDSYSFDKTMENEEINRNWNAEQAKLNRDFQASEADKNRSFTTAERVASQNWQAGQDQIARDWQAGENQAARDAAGNNGGNAVSRADVVQQLMDQYGYTPEQANAASYRIMPSEDPATNMFYDAINSGYSDQEAQIYVNAGGGEKGEDAVADNAAATADSFVNGLNLKVTGWNTFWSNQDDDGEIVASKVKGLLENNPQFKKMSAVQQNATKAATVGRMIASNWNKDGDATDNDVRLKVACNQLGVDYHAAKAYYDAYY